MPFKDRRIMDDYINNSPVDSWNQSNVSNHSYQNQKNINIPLANGGKVFEIQKDDSNRSAETSILILNDDGLLKIFDYLNVTDLCNMAQVCARINENAKIISLSKHKEFDFTLDNETNGNVTLFQACNLLR